MAKRDYQYIFKRFARPETKSAETLALESDKQADRRFFNQISWNVGWLNYYEGVRRHVKQIQPHPDDTWCMAYEKAFARWFPLMWLITQIQLAAMWRYEQPMRDWLVDIGWEFDPRKAAYDGAYAGYQIPTAALDTDLPMSTLERLETSRRECAEAAAEHDPRQNEAFDSGGGGMKWGYICNYMNHGRLMAEMALDDCKLKNDPEYRAAWNQFLAKDGRRLRPIPQETPTVH